MLLLNCLKAGKKKKKGRIFLFFFFKFFKMILVIIVLRSKKKIGQLLVWSLVGSAGLFFYWATTFRTINGYFSDPNAIFWSTVAYVTFLGVALPVVSLKTNKFLKNNF